MKWACLEITELVIAGDSESLRIETLKGFRVQERQELNFVLSICSFDLQRESVECVQEWKKYHLGW